MHQVRLPHPWVPKQKQRIEVRPRSLRHPLRPVERHRVRIPNHKVGKPIPVLRLERPRLIPRRRPNHAHLRHNRIRLLPKLRHQFNPNRNPHLVAQTLLQVRAILLAHPVRHKLTLNPETRPALLVTDHLQRTQKSDPSSLSHSSLGAFEVRSPKRAAKRRRRPHPQTNIGPS